jgi:hypothetical protein
MLTSAIGKGNAGETLSPADLHAFTTLEPIDTRVHIFKIDPAFGEFLQTLHLHVIDIVVANKGDATFPSLESKITAADGCAAQEFDR